MFLPAQILVPVGWFTLAAACFSAWRWGGGAERQGALLILAVTAGFAASDLVPRSGSVCGLYLVLDGVLAVGLLLLALRHATAWLGAAVLLQGVQFSLHAYYLVADRQYDKPYVTVNNLVTLGVFGCLLVGTVLARGRAAK